MAHERTATFLNRSSTSPPRKTSAVHGNDRGFTLLELLMVMTLIGILCILALQGFNKAKDTARRARAMTEIRGLEKQINSWAIDRGGVFPTSWAQLGVPTPKDPWSRDYVLTAPARTDMILANGDFDLYSVGTDGATDNDLFDDVSQDDILRAGDGGFVGLVESYLP